MVFFLFLQNYKLDKTWNQNVIIYTTFKLTHTFKTWIISDINPSMKSKQNLDTVSCCSKKMLTFPKKIWSKIIGQLYVLYKINAWVNGTLFNRTETPIYVNTRALPFIIFYFMKTFHIHLSKVYNINMSLIHRLDVPHTWVNSQRYCPVDTSDSDSISRLYFVHKITVSIQYYSVWSLTRWHVLCRKTTTLQLWLVQIFSM